MSATRPELVPVLAAHRFDEQALIRYLRERLAGFCGDVTIRQFQGGQSNPTYHLQTDIGEYVLRKKPSGHLLASAHAIDREYRIMGALAASAVPVPRMHLYCDDVAVIGQEFFVMENMAGAVHADPSLPELTQVQRRAVWTETVTVLGALHRVDHRAIGLDDFGRPRGYITRQVNRWSRQYLDSKIEDNADMDRLIDWLVHHDAPVDETAIAHGDYRTHNVIFDLPVRHVVAVIDWELSTIGHPLTDLAFCCLPFHLAPEDTVGFRGVDPVTLGIPTEAELLSLYCEATNRVDIANWSFFVVFAMFRMAAIRAGVFARAHQGNAANARALEAGLRYRITAERAWALAQR